MLWRQVARQWRQLHLSLLLLLLPRSLPARPAVRLPERQRHCATHPCAAPAGVGLSGVQGGKRGANVIQNAESGWRLHWRRPLQQELRGDRPTVRSVDGALVNLACCTTAAAVLHPPWRHLPSSVTYLMLILIAPEHAC